MRQTIISIFTLLLMLPAITLAQYKQENDILDDAAAAEAAHQTSDSQSQSLRIPFLPFFPSII